MAKAKLKRSDRASISAELQAVFDYWRDRADEADDPETSARWRAVQLEIERFAVGATDIADLRATLRPFTRDDPELAQLIDQLATLAGSHKSSDRQKAQMTR